MQFADNAGPDCTGRSEESLSAYRINGCCLFVCVEVYSPVNPMGSCRARSVYLTTRLLGRLSPLSC